MGEIDGRLGAASAVMQTLQQPAMIQKVDEMKGKHLDLPADLLTY